jgi:hypothetical protein
MSRSKGFRHLGVTLIAVVAVAAGCKTEPYDTLVHQRLLQIASENSVDCGRATTNAQNEQHTVCALEYLAGKRPFIVQYQLHGTDAISEYALALTAANRLSTVSTVSWGPAAKIGRIEVAECDLNKLHQTSSHYLVCD